jgi:glycerate 2-kinase
MTADPPAVVENRDALATSPARRVALDCLAAGIDAARPANVVPDAVAVRDGRLHVGGAAHDLSGYGEVLVVGAGKAAGGVAAELADLLGERLDGGAVVTDDPVDAGPVEVVEAAHPTPDERGVAGARRVRELVAGAGDDDLLLAVFTGGGSALLPAPAGDLELADLQAVTDELLAAGASVAELNAVRRHASAVKGGRLAETAGPARVVTLLVSDVVGDDPAVVASGPTAPDETTYGEALGVLDHHDVAAPAVRAHFEAALDGAHPETPGPEDDAFRGVDHHVLADGRTAIDAAVRTARMRGYATTVLSETVTGEAREAVTEHLVAADSLRRGEGPVDPPAVVFSGGETTVSVAGDGTGGPNQEFGLAAALGLGLGGRDSSLHLDGVVVGAVDTDGRDGATDAAGALVDGATVDDPDPARAALEDNDAYRYLAERNALVRTGHTGTNVNDLRVVVVP